MSAPEILGTPLRHTDAPAVQEDVRLLLEEVFSPQRWSRGATLAELLLAGLDDAAGATGDEASRITPRAGQFAAMVRRVARDFDSHPLRDVFVQLLQDDRDLRDEQLPALIGCLYSSIVNNFKGEIAEILARPVIRRFADRLELPVTVISGWDVSEPKLEGRRLIWAKGADGLLITGGDRLGIAAVVEIKSYRANPARMNEQVRKHVARLCRGLRVCGKELASNDYDFILADGTRIAAADAPRAAQLASLCIRTPSAGLTEPVISDGLTAAAELALTKDELATAAFAMTEWFLARLGPVVFHLPGDPRPGAVVTRWPDDSLDDVGRWATGEAFFHLSARLEQYTQREDSPRTRRALRGTYWLYNAMNFGYENARGDRMVWLEELLPPPPEVDAEIEAARDHYRDGELQEVRAALAGVRTRNPNADQLRKIAWLEAMTEYRDAEFEKARSLFPGASGRRSDVWNHRDLLMEARLAARTGRLDVAAAKLAQTLALRVSPLGFATECQGARRSFAPAAAIVQASLVPPRQRKPMTPRFAAGSPSGARLASPTLTSIGRLWRWDGWTLRGRWRRPALTTRPSGGFA